jgi:hypothetical protein
MASNPVPTSLPSAPTQLLWTSASCHQREQQSLASAVWQNGTLDDETLLKTCEASHAKVGAILSSHGIQLGECSSGYLRIDVAAKDPRSSAA